MKKRVADIIVDTLAGLGVKNNFCVVGGVAMHLNNAFAINKDIKTVYCHHEQACAFAAEGYAKLNGDIAAVTVTSGPGAANTLNGVYSAWVDSTPMIVIAGFPRTDTTVKASGLDLRCRGVQELDIIPMVKGITKYAVLLENPLEVKKVVREAYYQASEGRKGPAWISVPLDIQAAVIEEGGCVPENVHPEKENTFSYELLCKVEKALRVAKRPAILAGAGLRYDQAVENLHKLFDKVRIPIVGGALSPDIITEDIPLYYGMSGNTGPRTGNFVLQNSDCILVLGNSLSNRQIGYNADGFAPDAKIIMVDVSQDEMRKPGLRVSIAVEATLNCFLKSFYGFLSEDIAASREWIDFCNRISELFRNYDDPHCESDERVPYRQFWKVFREKIPADVVLALGNSNCVVGVYQYGLKRKGQRILTNRNAGSMGYDLPEAFGAAFATNSPIICVTGDGSIMMNLQELQTIRYHELPIKLVVFSNDGYGAIRQTCKNYFNGIYAGCDPDTGVGMPSFKEIANAFGFRYIECRNCGELENSIDSFVAADGRVLLQIDQKLDDQITPRIMSKLREDGTFETPAFVDLSPFVSEDVQLKIDEMERRLKDAEYPAV